VRSDRGVALLAAAHHEGVEYDCPVGFSKQTAKKQQHKSVRMLGSYDSDVKEVELDS
jgi:hypothetical protein